MEKFHLAQFPGLQKTVGPTVHTLNIVVCVDQRIKANQIQKLLREEKDVLAEQVVTFQQQVEAQNLVVRKLEEKERILLSNLAAIEKELA